MIRKSSATYGSPKNDHDQIKSQKQTSGEYKVKILINKTVSKTVKEIATVDFMMSIPYWMANKHCHFCHFDLDRNSQIIAFQYGLGNIGHAHNDCFNSSMTKAAENKQAGMR